ncbi:MAG TPA: YHS domain-containing protein [Nitrospirales bacterium]|nr:YHS domain-containing protein [Nitrospirales bacterium]
MLAAGTVKDPVCQMEIEPEDAAATAEYKGTKYFFCADVCKKEFEKNPKKYVTS